MKKFASLPLILFFVLLTVLLTIAVVYAWEQVLMSPLYSYFETHYPGDENLDKRWRMSQRVEHFFISVTVDAIVVTLLLRMIDSRQRRLRESEERYRAIFEHASDGISVVTAADHRIISTNMKFAEILGYQAQALIGRHVCELLREGDDSRPSQHSDILTCSQPIEKTATDLSTVTDFSWSGDTEMTIQPRSGGVVPVLASCSALSTDHGRLFILIIRDLAEQKRLEREREQMQRQLFQSSKLASIGELSAGVAHEINNPLNGIINYAQLLKDDGVARNDTERQMIDGIIDEGDRIAVIVRNLLTFARQDPHLPTGVQVAQVIQNSVSLFGRQLEKDGITVEIQVADDINPVLADASRLRQVVVNMISNAHFALKTKQADSKIFKISARNLEQENRAVVRMEFFDNGVGIRKESLEKVFDPFFTTRRDGGGTGLGLSLSFGIIRDYGGTISVESEEGSYTRFIVDLPAASTREADYAESLSGRRRAEHKVDDGGAA